MLRAIVNIRAQGGEGGIGLLGINAADMSNSCLPSLISLEVSVDVKRHVYFNTSGVVCVISVRVQ